MGTPRYMSPEQCKSARDVTDRSDVYTLGLILYEMLSGESPYADVKAEIMLMGAQIGQPAPPLADKGTLASPELCALTHRMLDKNPEVRPTAAEVATMLKRMTAGPPSQPVPIVPEAARADTAEGTVKSSASESPGKRPTGGPYLIGAATVALFLGLIGLLLVLRSSLRPVQPPPKPVFIHFRIVSEPTLAELFDESGTLIGHTPFENSQPRAQRSLTFTVHKNNFADRRVAVDLESDSENNVALDPIPPPPPLITPVTEKAAASKRKNPRKR